MKELKIVQIGASGHYEYVLPTAKKYGFEISAISPGSADEDISRALRDMENIGQKPKIYDDWRLMIDSEKPDVAVINSYMGYNADMCIYALERGIHVFCEKPVATTLCDLLKLRRVYKDANENGKVVFAGMFGIMYAPHFETALRCVSAGTIGEVRLLNAQKSYRLGKRELFYSSRELLGGMIPWVAIHGIDWIYRFGGADFVSVTASHSRVSNGGNGDLEATALMMFEGENGKIASVSADYLRPSAAPTHDDDRIRVVGTKGIVEVRQGKVYLLSDGGEEVLENTLPEHQLFEEFALEISGEGVCRVSAKETFDVTEIALIARQSADDKRKIGICL